MMTSGFFRLLSDLPKIFWRYPVSFLSFGSWGIQVTCFDQAKLFLDINLVQKKKKNMVTLA